MTDSTTSSQAYWFRHHTKEIASRLVSLREVVTGLSEMAPATKNAAAVLIGDAIEALRAQDHLVDANKMVDPKTTGRPPEERAEDMMEVLREDANNYCQILTLLGLEEEGDPVAAVEVLIKAAARYRFLRGAPDNDENGNGLNVGLWEACSGYHINGDALDAAIDAAMAANTTEGK